MLFFVIFFILGKREISTSIYLSTSRYNNIENETSFFKYENTPTIKDPTHTSAGYGKGSGSEDRIQTIWQAMLGLLTILTITYIGKCVYRVCKSKSSQLDVHTLASAECPTKEDDDHVQRPSTYEQPQIDEDDRVMVAYEEIRASGILLHEIIMQDQVHEDDMTYLSSSVSTNSTLNKEIDVMEIDKDDAYITPYM